MSSTTAEVLACIESLCGTLGSASAHRAARLLDHVGADLSLITPDGLRGPQADDLDWARGGLASVREDRVRHWGEQIERLERDGVSVITAGTADYPLNLRLVPNRPPVLFVRGSLATGDERAIAVVGTRQASPEGRRTAETIARKLSKAGITVVSGLAEGIDSVAHRSAIDAGGRTIAVFGTGIDRMFPASNRSLAAEVARSGACVSQWWPGQGGTKWTFPLRNIVTSGLSLGTVVVEASATSGARLQAEDARRHGRRLFLVERLVTMQPWAKTLVDEPGVHVVRNVKEIRELVELDLANDSFSLT